GVSAVLYLSFTGIPYGWKMFMTTFSYWIALLSCYYTSRSKKYTSAVAVLHLSRYDFTACNEQGVLDPHSHGIQYAP
ncbi:MAG: hypothetical protein IJH77_05515, partial [Mogibacterium sp.]|nr:hypothetical protein [Mogibacterium sp.]